MKRKTAVFIIFLLAAAGLISAFIVIFFDQAVFLRRDTFYLGHVSEKVVALTFDDGPSRKWTPLILEALKTKGVKATFFMIGEHVQKYPEVARQVAFEGHDLGIHTFHHKNMVFVGEDELKKDIEDTQALIKEVTGKQTKLFRPPKAWLTQGEKKRIRRWGFKTVLWNLNSKDWVTFDDKYMLKYLLAHVRPGDILLFHDSGGAFGIEGGNRQETVKAIPVLIDKLHQRGYRFVTVSELLEMDKENAKKQDL